MLADLVGAMPLAERAIRALENIAVDMHRIAVNTRHIAINTMHKDEHEDMLENIADVMPH